jgi:hypothetical protein
LKPIQYTYPSLPMTVHASIHGNGIMFSVVFSLY